MPRLQPGHNIQPTPEKRGMPGRSRDQRIASRNLSMAVREKVSPDLLTEIHIAIVCGHANVRGIDNDVDRPRPGYSHVTWPENGSASTTEQVAAATKWLSDRGWGQPAQQIHLEAELRAQIVGVVAGVDINTIATDKLAALQAALVALRPVALEDADAPAPIVRELEPASPDVET